jgi:hypothetical protein
MRQNTQGKWPNRTRESLRRFSPSVVLQARDTTNGSGILGRVLSEAESVISQHKNWAGQARLETALEEIISVLAVARRRFAAPAIYVSGPMSGLPNLNMEAFNEAEQKLRKAGWPDVRNPAGLAVNLYKNLPRGLYLRADLRQLLDCHVIFLLRGWEKSKGARLEALIADEVGMGRIYEEKNEARTNDTKRVNQALRQAIHHEPHDGMAQGKKTGDKKH